MAKRVGVRNMSKDVATGHAVDGSYRHVSPEETRGHDPDTEGTGTEKAYCSMCDCEGHTYMAHMNESMSAGDGEDSGSGVAKEQNKASQYGWANNEYEGSTGYSGYK